MLHRVFTCLREDSRNETFKSCRFNCSPVCIAAYIVGNAYYPKHQTRRYLSCFGPLRAGLTSCLRSKCGLMFAMAFARAGGAAALCPWELGALQTLPIDVKPVVRKRPHALGGRESVLKTGCSNRHADSRFPAVQIWGRIAHVASKLIHPKGSARRRSEQKVKAKNARVVRKSSNLHVLCTRTRMYRPA
jgi:hypothetical protein